MGGSVPLTWLVHDDEEGSWNTPKFTFLFKELAAAISEGTLYFFLPVHFINMLRGTQFIVITAPFMVLATIILILRLYTRLWIGRNAGAEDVLVVFAWVG